MTLQSGPTLEPEGITLTNGWMWDYLQKCAVTLGKVALFSQGNRREWGSQLATSSQIWTLPVLGSMSTSLLKLWTIWMVRQNVHYIHVNRHMEYIHSVWLPSLNEIPRRSVHAMACNIYSYCWVVVHWIMWHNLPILLLMSNWFVSSLRLSQIKLRCILFIIQQYWDVVHIPHNSLI